MRLTLKPIGAVDRSVLTHLQAELKGFNEIVIVPEGPLPAQGYDAARKQYRASDLFPVCAAEAGTRVLGITEADLWDEDRTFVFGYAQISDRAAVISLAHLRGRRPRDGWRPGGVRMSPRAQRKFLERIIKEAVHEIGHTLGLGHDEDHPECVMFYSRRLRDTDRKRRDYCPSCAARAEVTLKRLRT